MSTGADTADETSARDSDDAELVHLIAVAKTTATKTAQSAKLSVYFMILNLVLNILSTVDIYFDAKTVPDSRSF